MSNLFDNSLERADRQHYITGVPAINFPTSKNTGGWHFLNYFDLDRGVFKVSLSGIHYPSTNKYFGDFGIVDISNKLDALKIPHFNKRVFMATHHRAAADILIKWAISGKVHCTVEADEWFPAKSDRDALVNVLTLAKEKLEEDGLWIRLQSWMTSQLESGSKKTPFEENTFH
ncbi:hypothetical protein [Pseudomonas sp. S1(2024)]|uniref:hypothetical protein n=1 Tax=Pseudomonas sp. S1(2024) TaxID=3390191 RepID=UPI00397B0F69